MDDMTTALTAYAQVTAERDDLAERLERAEAAIAAVRELHVEGDHGCDEDNYHWPCATIRALDAAPTTHRECKSAACAQINEWYVQAERKLDAVHEALA